MSLQEQRQRLRGQLVELNDRKEKLNVGIANDLSVINMLANPFLESWETLEAERVKAAATSLAVNVAELRDVAGKIRAITKELF
jgi:hypothetical protein